MFYNTRKKAAKEKKKAVQMKRKKAMKREKPLLKLLQNTHTCVCGKSKSVLKWCSQIVLRI